VRRPDIVPSHYMSMNHPSDSFETVVRDYYEPLFRFALSLTRAEAEAQDLTQQTFYTWATKGHQLRDFSKAKTWLFTTLHRAFLETRRRHVRFRHEDLDEAAGELPVFNQDYANPLDGHQILALLAQVDEVYQAAVALCYLEDCSYQEMAEILGVPVGTVKSRVSRGLMQLRSLLSSAESEPTPSAPKRLRPARAGHPPSEGVVLRRGAVLALA
jgi:RNA polymerase sigma-70 factor, ECF subfamily